MRILFKQLDLDGDGFVTRGELASGLRTIPRLAHLLGADPEVITSTGKASLNSLFQSIDKQSSGHISWTDFLLRLEYAASKIPKITIELKVSTSDTVTLVLSGLKGK